jgi:hypothetical protein
VSTLEEQCRDRLVKNQDFTVNIGLGSSRSASTLSFSWKESGLALVTKNLNSESVTSEKTLRL